MDGQYLGSHVCSGGCFTFIKINLEYKTIMHIFFIKQPARLASAGFMDWHTLLWWNAHRAVDSNVWRFLVFKRLCFCIIIFRKKKNKKCIRKAVQKWHLHHVITHMSLVYEIMNSEVRISQKVCWHLNKVESFVFLHHHLSTFFYSSK